MAAADLPNEPEPSDNRHGRLGAEKSTTTTATLPTQVGSSCSTAATRRRSISALSSSYASILTSNSGVREGCVS
jgi:hypothetical protein